MDDDLRWRSWEAARQLNAGWLDTVPEKPIGNLSIKQSRRLRKYVRVALKCFGLLVYIVVGAYLYAWAVFLWPEARPMIFPYILGAMLIAMPIGFDMADD
jgi:hypothetical protein